MANTITHRFVSAKADSADTTKVRKSNWNDEHVFAGGAIGSLLFRDTGTSDGGNWLAAVATGSVLVSGGVGASPAWSATPTLTDLTLTGQGLGKDGTFSSPAWTFASDPDTGFYSPSSNQIGITAGGVALGRFYLASTEAELWLATNAARIGFGASEDTFLVRGGANYLQLRNGANACAFGVFNTYTSSTSFEGLFMQWAANVAYIGTEKGSGGGSARNLAINVGGSTVAMFVAGGLLLGSNANRFLDDGGGVFRMTNSADVGGQVIWTSTGVQFKSGTGGGATDTAIVRAAAFRSTAVTVANLPATPAEGMLVAVTDSTTTTWGATITGGGANHVLAYYNGTNWTVAGK